MSIVNNVNKHYCYLKNGEAAVFSNALRNVWEVNANLSGFSYKVEERAFLFDWNARSI